MRVLHVISGLAIADGHAAFCLQLAEQLAGRGLAQRILALPTPGEPTHPDPRGLVQFVGGRQARLMNLVLPLGLRRQWAMHLAGFQPTIVHLHGGWHPFLFLCMRLARRAGLPVVLTLHGSLRPAVVEQDRRLKKRLAWHLYQRRLVAGADQIHVASEAEQSDLARLGFDQPVHVIPNGVTLTEARLPCEDARSAGESRTLLYLGRLHPLKGLDLLLEAWARVQQTSGCLTGEGEGETGGFNAETQRRRGEEGDGEGGAGENAQRSTLNAQRLNDPHPRTPTHPHSHTPTHPHSHTHLRWRLVIAGPDEQGTRAALERQARRLGLRLSAHEPVAPAVPPAGAATEAPGLDLDPTIIYVGPCYGDEKLRLLREADLVVLPSRSENFGLVIAEALATGVPVIATTAAPWAELLGSSKVLKCGSSKVGTAVLSGNAGACDPPCASVQKTPELSNSRTPELPNSRTSALPNSRTSELPNSRTSPCGWWVEVSVEPLAAALREAMLLDDETRRAMGACGQRLIRERYGWEQVAERMVGVYRQVSGEW